MKKTFVFSTLILIMIYITGCNQVSDKSETNVDIGLEVEQQTVDPIAEAETTIESTGGTDQEETIIETGDPVAEAEIINNE